MHPPHDELPDAATEPLRARALLRLSERTRAGALRATLSSRHERVFLTILGVLYGLVPTLALFDCLYVGGLFGLILYVPGLILYLLALALTLLAVIFAEASARRARAALTRRAYGELRAQLPSDAPPGALELTSAAQERAGALTQAQEAGAVTITTREEV